jgi:hypothetical protein
MARSPAGAVLAPCAWGKDQLDAAIDEIRRATDLGVRSVLVSDLGVLATLGRLRAIGELPADLQAKVSVMLPVANPATAEVVVGLGANTLNLPTDLGLSQIAEIRAAVTVPLDIYVEAPDNDVYPSGTHLDDLTVALSRERVRRARLGLDLLERAGATAMCSKPGAAGLAIPVP